MGLNIFVLGLDDLNHRALKKLPGAEDYTFHQLLSFDALQDGAFTVNDLLEKAEQQLDAFDGSIDAIVAYWDFPATAMAPILAERHSLPHANLRGIVTVEHKYWSRLEQQKVAGEEIPGFGLIDLNDPEVSLPGDMSFPAWIKPIKSTSSEGAYRITDSTALNEALEEERQVVDRMGGGFNEILERVDLPQEIAEIGGSAAMVEEEASGSMLTVEGYSYKSEVHVYGVIDSHLYEGTSSFLRYQYPSQLPADVQEHIGDVSRRVIEAVGLHHSTFNIEYFWDAERQKLRLLEINSRHSQSHAQLFYLVDGRPNHACMVDLALGNRPAMPAQNGEFKVAGTWFLRRFQDGWISRVPTPEEVRAVEEKHPGTAIQIEKKADRKLSGDVAEDAYSYTLAEIFTAGQTEEEMVETYNKVVDELNFEIEDL
ncbi:ATP-grasp domain-containing protein [Nesterenkonia populi]|uniref:ATP-grasp domain-containing protein n=1 Tax=Nesterenkonia populi TaxID=1591087 RepID=UPI001B85F4EE|nr:ATP-grasp domain-containing protein [Nesterenkonia populi]